MSKRTKAKKIEAVPVWISAHGFVSSRYKGDESVCARGFAFRESDYRAMVKALKAARCVIECSNPKHKGCICRDTLDKALDKVGY